MNEKGKDSRNDSIVNVGLCTLGSFVCGASCGFIISIMSFFSDNKVLGDIVFTIAIIG